MAISGSSFAQHSDDLLEEREEPMNDTVKCDEGELAMALAGPPSMKEAA